MWGVRMGRRKRSYKELTCFYRFVEVEFPELIDYFIKFKFGVGK